MYVVCAIRFVCRQMVSVALCDSAEYFVSLWRDQRRTGTLHPLPPQYSDSVAHDRLGTALTPVSSLRTLTGLAFVYAALIVPSSLKSEAFVISDEIHYVDFTTTSIHLCHSQEGCNFITFPWTNRLMFRLHSSCILVFRSSVGQQKKKKNGSDHLLSNQTLLANPVLSFASVPIAQ